MSVVPWSQRGIARFQAEDRESLTAFQRAHFGQQAIQCCDAHFPWLFEQVPAPDAEGMQLWVCKRGDAIVGQQGGIPFRLKAGARSLRASWGIDLMVAPEWRLRGVGPALSEAQANAGEVAVSLGMSDAAYKSYKRAGWIDLGTIPSYLRVIDPVRALAAAGKGHGWRRLAAMAGRPLLTLASVAYGAAAWANGARLEEMAAFDERADALWRDAGPSHGVTAERTLDFLRWRFDRKPGAGTLRRFAVMKNGRMMAYLVLRVDQWRGAPLGVVVDYLACPGWRLPAFALLTERARRLGLAALLVRALDAPAARPLAAMGFVCLKNGLNKATRIMVRPGAALNDDEANSTMTLLSDPSRWFVTAADSDIGFKTLGG